MDPHLQAPFTGSHEEQQRQERWLRNLIRGLVGEAHVDDVLQETWTTALRNGPAIARPTAWLATVAKNAARKVLRSDRRRIHREQVVATEEALPSTEDTLALFELQRIVMRAVEELGEPTRTTVLLRYVHGLPIGQVAEKTGVNQATTRQRIKRGLDSLRDKLESNYQEDWRSLPALGPWLIPGATTMQMKNTGTLIGIGVTLILASGLGIWSLNSANQDTGQGVPQKGSLLADAVEESQATLSTPTIENRAPIVDPAAPSVSPPAIPEATGVLLDHKGKALAGIAIASGKWRPVPAAGLLRPASAHLSGPMGQFPMDTPEVPVISDPTWIAVAARKAKSEWGQATIVATRAIELEGEVRNEHSVPLAGVQVNLVDVGLPNFVGIVEGLTLNEWSGTSSDTYGRFALRDLPSGMGHLRFEKEGYRTQQIELEEWSNGTVLLEMVPDTELYTATGWVSTNRGTPVSGARVGLGTHETRSLADGSFRLAVSREAQLSDYDDLWAAFPGWQTLVLPDAGKALRAAPDGSAEYDLVLPMESLSLQGVILDALGEPVPGLEIYPWARKEITPGVSPEDLSLPEAQPILPVGPGIRTWCQSDEQGHFRLHGLGDQEYQLCLYDREGFAALVVGPFAAGDHALRIELPADFVRTNLTGYVKDPEGLPVQGVEVIAMIPVYYGTTVQFDQGPKRAISDEQGRFELEVAPGHDLNLMLQGEGVMPFMHSVANGPLKAPIRIQVERKCHFRLVLTGDRAKALEVQVLDGAGKHLNIAVLGAGDKSWSTRRALKQGKTAVYSVPQTAAFLVVNSGRNDPGQRLPISLRPGELNEINW